VLSHRSSGAAVIVLIAVSGLLAQEAPPPQAPSPFRSATTLVPVDVRVLDRDGRPVTNLTSADFTIEEDDVPQRIAHFAAQPLMPDATAAETARPRRAADAFDATASRRRTFLIVLGRGRLQPPSKGVDAMLHLVESRLLPQDQVAVLAWNRATDFTTDHAAIAEVLERFKREHEGLETRIVLWERSMQSWFNPRDLPADIQRDIDNVFGAPKSSHTMAGDLDGFLDHHATVLNDLTALYLGVEYLRYLAGEKHLVFVSEFGVALRGVDGDRHLGRLAADARVALDVIHAGGVPFGWNGLNPAPPGLGMPEAMTARDLARLTGGTFYNHRFPNASMDVDAIDTATRFNYLLGYYPARAEADGTFRRITVHVNRSGVTLLHRDGYFAKVDAGTEEPRNLLAFSRIASAAAYDRPIADLGVDVGRAVAHMTGRSGQATIDVSIDLSKVSFDTRDGRNRATVEIALFCLGRDDESVGEARQTVELNYTDERLAEMRKSGFVHTAIVPVTKPPANVKIVVYDYGSDLVGTKVAPIGLR
jgi:VWFA-related protein